MVEPVGEEARVLELGSEVGTWFADVIQVPTGHFPAYLELECV